MKLFQLLWETFDNHRLIITWTFVLIRNVEKPQTFAPQISSVNSILTKGRADSSHQLLSPSVPTDLANWGPPGPDRTTKIFQTGPNGPGPDLPEKETDEMVQQTFQNLTMLNAYLWLVFESLLLSFYKVWIILKS